MSDYFPAAGESGNGKAFVLSKPKTPAEIACEKIRQSSPELRREVSRLRLPVAAKWLFDRISDDSFWEIMGGDRYGTICTTLTDLARTYHHDREAIGMWLKKLIEAGVVWVEEERGFLIIHLAAFIPPPSHRAGMVARAKARASGAVASRTDVFFAENGKSAAKAAISRAEIGSEPHSVRLESAPDADRSRTACGYHPHETTAGAAEGGVDIRFPCGQEPHAVTVESASGADSNLTGVEKNSLITVEKESPKSLQDGKDVENVKPLSVQRGFNALKRKGGENSFLLEVAEILSRWNPRKAEAELKGWGGWWRNKFRADAEKAWRVLGEVKSYVLEGKIKIHPGKMAVDLWKRLP